MCMNTIESNARRYELFELWGEILDMGTHDNDPEDFEMWYTTPCHDHDLISWYHA